MHINHIEMSNVELTLVLEALQLKLKLRESGIVKESSKAKSRVMINETEKLYLKLIHNHCEVVEK